MKTSLGIWALGPMTTRFVPGGYQPQWIGESMEAKLRRAIDGLGDLMDGYEFHSRTSSRRTTSTSCATRSTGGRSTASCVERSAQQTSSAVRLHHVSIAVTAGGARASPWLLRRPARPRGAGRAPCPRSRRVRLVPGRRRSRAAPDARRRAAPGASPLLPGRGGRPRRAARPARGCGRSRPATRRPSRPPRFFCHDPFGNLVELVRVNG